MKLSNSRKQLASPYATGGGGVIFETRVHALFATLMLTGGSVPCMPCWPVIKIKLQGRYKGYNTDDLIVYIEHPETGQKRKLLGQITRTISITEGNAKFGEVIQAAWRDYNDTSLFAKGKDAFALITSPLSAKDNSVRELLEWARHSKNAKEFFDKVSKTNFSSKAKRDKLQILRAHLKTDNKNIDV